MSISSRPDDGVAAPARPTAPSSVLRCFAGLRRWLSLAVVVLAAYAAGAAPDREALHSAAAAAAIAFVAYVHQDRRTRLRAEHDRQLYRRFLHELPADGAALRFLRRPGTDSAPRAAIEALERFLTGWHNVESEFTNEYLGSHLRQLQRAIGVLLRLQAEQAQGAAASARHEVLRGRVAAAAAAVLLAHQELVWQGRRLL